MTIRRPRIQPSFVTASAISMCHGARVEEQRNSSSRVQRHFTGRPDFSAASADSVSVAVDERRREGPAASFDLAGALTVTLGLLALVYGIVSAGAHGWGSLAALGPIALGLVLLALFLFVEANLAAAPLLPLRAFSNRLLRVSNAVVLVFSAALFPTEAMGGV